MTTPLRTAQADRDAIRAIYSRHAEKLTPDQRRAFVDAIEAATKLAHAEAAAAYNRADRDAIRPLLSHHVRHDHGQLSPPRLSAENLAAWHITDHLAHQTHTHDHGAGS